MTLKNLIVSKAFELVQLLEHYDDNDEGDDFVNSVVRAVSNCDYSELLELEERGGAEG